jgi:hypothetical protein
VSADPIELEDGEWRVVHGVLRWVDVPPPVVTERQVRAKLRAVKAAEFDPTLIACPTCRATVTQKCHTAGGNVTAPHADRLVSCRCLCGDLLESRKQYCEQCRARARKDTYRRREIRNATAQRRRAS